MFALKRRPRFGRVDIEIKPGGGQLRALHQFRMIAGEPHAAGALGVFQQPRAQAGGHDDRVAPGRAGVRDCDLVGIAVLMRGDQGA